MHVGMMVCKLTRQHAAKGQGFVPWDSKPQTRSNKILPGNQPTHEGWPSMHPWPHLLSIIARVVNKTSCLCRSSRPCRRNTDAKSDDLSRNNNISLALRRSSGVLISLNIVAVRYGDTVCPYRLPESPGIEFHAAVRSSHGLKDMRSECRANSHMKLLASFSWSLSDVFSFELFPKRIHNLAHHLTVRCCFLWHVVTL